MIQFKRKDGFSRGIRLLQPEKYAEVAMTTREVRGRSPQGAKWGVINRMENRPLSGILRIELVHYHWKAITRNGDVHEQIKGSACRKWGR